MSLEAKTLKQKDYFTPGKTPFTSSPVVFQYKGKDFIVAGNQDGRLYLLDSASLGGADHKTPLFATPPVPGGGSPDPGRMGVSTFEEADGTRWVVAAAGVVTGFKIVDASGAVTLQPAWSSGPNVSWLTPVVVNGVVFAVSSGEPRGQANAVLRAFDLTTGKELWTSGSAIAASVRGIGPVANDSQVYIVGADGTLYAFGFPTER